MVVESGACFWCCEEFSGPRSSKDCSVVPNWPQWRHSGDAFLPKRWLLWLALGLFVAVQADVRRHGLRGHGLLWCRVAFWQASARAWNGRGLKWNGAVKTEPADCSRKNCLVYVVRATNGSHMCYPTEQYHTWYDWCYVVHGRHMIKWKQIEMANDPKQITENGY